MKAFRPYILFTTIIVFYFSCSAPNQKVDIHAQSEAEIKKNGFLVSSVLGSNNLLLQTNTYTGVIFNGKKEKLEDGSAFTPTVKDVLLSEKLLLTCLNKDTIDYSHESIIIRKSQIYPLTHYKRQYFGEYDDNGIKILTIYFSPNCQDDPWWNERWLRQRLSPNDGGKSYWRISVDLTNKRCGYFMVNGDA